MKHLFRAFSLLLVSVFSFQCQKDLSFVGGPDRIPVVITPEPVKANLQGNIVDENGQPAAGVNITVGNLTALTNVRGYFRMEDAALDKNTSLVVAEKAGYFKGYRVFSATAGTNQVVIKLVKKILAGTIAASAGGAASLSNGASVSLPANGIVVASSGSPYTGDVKVFAAYIDPRANDIAETVPGSFAGNDKAGKRVILSSYGMLAVELESTTGEKLQIKPGAVATLTSPITSSALSAAPASIALWYADEQTGIWKEEGSATKQGNNYVGDVKHFSFWNCDYPFDAVSLSVTLHDPKGLPLTGVSVRISVTDTGSAFAYGYTDSIGEVKGLVPSGKNLLLEVLDPCGNSVYSKTISSLTDNTDLGTIIVSGTNSFLLTITGVLLDCNGSPVSSGYAILNYNNFVRYVAVDAAGVFTSVFVTCSGISATAEILGVDLGGQQQGAVTNVTVTSPVTNAGNITACGTSSLQYINYTLDGEDSSITSAGTDSIGGNTSQVGATMQTLIKGGQTSPTGIFNFVSFSVDNASTGSFPLSSLFVFGFSNIILTQPFNVTFTNFPANAGEFYKGSFSGQFTADSVATVHNISADFKIRRNF